ncbi:MAG: HYExAFE family protein [Phycisphaerales bacterium]
MSQERYHYESAFAAMLRTHRVPFVGVDEARRTLLPVGGTLGKLKSFDFVVYGRAANFLVDIKGRRLAGAATANWTTREDIESLLEWERLFGDRFRSVLVFMFETEVQPADGVFDEVFASGPRWYSLKTVGAREYSRCMRTRSASWGTVDVPRRVFDAMPAAAPPWSMPASCA